MPKDIVLNRFLSVWPATLAALCRFLVSARRLFDGDLDSALIMLVVMEKTVSARIHQKQGFEDFKSMDLDQSDLPLSALTTHALAAHLGIPRESTRRKIERLIEKGWIIKTAKGVMHATPKARAELMPLIVGSIDLLVEIDEAMHP